MGDENQTPPQENQPTPTPQGEQPPAAPPPAQPDLSARLQQLEAENQKLSSYVQVLAQQAQQGQQVQPQRLPEEPVDTSQLDPAVVQLLNKTQQGYMQRLESMQEQMDYMNFTATAKETGVEQPVLQEAERIYQQWKRTGFKTMDGNGQQQPPSRMDALVFAAGHQGLTTRAAARRAPPPPNPQAVTERTGTVSRAPAQSNIDALPLDQRLAARAKVLDEEGF